MLSTPSAGDALYKLRDWMDVGKEEGGRRKEGGGRREGPRKGKQSFCKPETQEGGRKAGRKIYLPRLWLRKTNRGLEENWNEVEFSSLRERSFKDRWLTPGEGPAALNVEAGGWMDGDWMTEPLLRYGIKTHTHTHTHTHKHTHTESIECPSRQKDTASEPGARGQGRDPKGSGGLLRVSYTASSWALAWENPALGLRTLSCIQA